MGVPGVSLGVVNCPSRSCPSDVVAPTGRAVSIGFNVLESSFEFAVCLGVSTRRVSVGRWCSVTRDAVLVGDDGGVLSNDRRGAEEVLLVEFAASVGNSRLLGVKLVNVLFHVVVVRLA